MAITDRPIEGGGLKPVIAASARVTYLGGETLAPNGSSLPCNIPAGTNAFWIDAEGGDIYYVINPGAAPASANSPGYCPQNMARVMGIFDSLTSLRIYAAAGAAKAHIQYFKE